MRSSPIPFTSSAESSILPIVTSQRDRFRQRNAELEEVNQNFAGLVESRSLILSQELRKQFNIISELRSEVRARSPAGE